MNSLSFKTKFGWGDTSTEKMDMVDPETGEPIVVGKTDGIFNKILKAMLPDGLVDFLKNPIGWVMNFIGIDKKEAHSKFGFLLDAYKYGGPTHGGMGLGIDRTVALMCGINDIREVIAFPKNKNAECPMDSCPSTISDKQLKELSVKLDIVKKKE